MNAGQEMLKQLSFSNPFSKLLFTEATLISRPGFFFTPVAQLDGQQQQILPRMRDLARYGLSRYGNTADDWMVRYGPRRSKFSHRLELCTCSCRHGGMAAYTKLNVLKSP